jgi:hypothetical protein
MVVGNGDYRIVMGTAWWRAWFIPRVSILMVKVEESTIHLGSSHGLLPRSLST